MSRILFENRRCGTLLLTDYGTQNSVFQQVLDVRKRDENEHCELPWDTYSHHYLLANNDQAVGAISLTVMREGAIDCQAHYPQSLLTKYGNQIETAYAFHILSSGQNAFNSVIRMFRSIWRDRLPHGSRLHLVNATGTLIDRYQAIGYTPIPNAIFTHPRLLTPSVPMILPADPNHRSICQQLFTEIASPLSLADVQQACNLTNDTPEACQ